jgi:hypothetical protein
MIRSSFGDQQTARDLQSKSPMAIISLQLAANGIHTSKITPYILY